MSTNRRRAASERPRAQRPPFSFADDEERTIEIRAYGEYLSVDEFEPLVGLYGAFEPADRALGLPPTGGTRIRKWLETLLAGRNLLAWHGDVVAGHAALVEVRPGAYELGTFVHRAYQRAGIGFRLVTTLLDDGKRNGVENVRLLVERTRQAAVARYRRLGFEPMQPRGHTLEMAQTL